MSEINDTTMYHQSYTYIYLFKTISRSTCGLLVRNSFLSLIPTNLNDYANDSSSDNQIRYRIICVKNHMKTNERKKKKRVNKHERIKKLNK
jgi:hypothetical protein